MVLRGLARVVRVSGTLSIYETGTGPVGPGSETRPDRGVGRDGRRRPVSALDDLVDRPAGRDHRQDVLLVGDQDVEDVGAGVVDHGPEGGDHVLLAADLPGLDPEPLGD